MLGRHFPSGWCHISESGSSPLAFKLFNFVLAVLSRGPTWQGLGLVYNAVLNQVFSDQNCVKTRPYHFGFRCLVKTLLWKLIIPRYLFFPKFLFFRFFSWVCSQVWVGKKRYQQIITIAQLYLLFFYTCTNKGHMKIWYFFQNLQYTITIIQIQMSKN